MRLLLLALLAWPANASDWVPADPGGSTSDGNVSAPDKLNFWERLQDKTFDGLCRQAEIPIDAGRRLGDFADPSGGFHRYLRQMPTGELAIIDEARLTVPFGWLPRGTFDRGTLHANLDFSLGARIQGRSIVVRRLNAKKACAELSKLVDFRTIKTALPVTAARIAAMAEGEIWQLPVEFRMGIGASVGDDILFPVVVGIGAHREAGVTVTLRRLDERTLRFRLRLERATVYDARGKINANIPVLLLGLPGGEGVLAAALGGIARGAVRSINDYLAVQLGLEFRRTSGTQHALEYSLDPTDPGQMERLARAIKGDLSVLALIKRTVSRGALDPWDAIASAADDEDKVLGAEPSFAGEDRTKRRQVPFKFQVPFLGRYERSTASESDRVFLEDRAGGEYSVYRGEKRSRRAYLNLPFLGDLFARDAQKNAEVMVHRDPTGRAQGPAIVYVQQEGFVRQDAHDARRMAKRTGELMALAGTRGKGENPKTALPIDRIAPPSPANAPGAFWRETEHKRGVAALTVVFNEQAVRTMLKASTKALLGAYVNTLEGPAKLMGEWLIAHARASGPRVDYDKGEAIRAAFTLARDAGVPVWRLLWGLSQADRQVTALSKRLGTARAAQSEEGKAHALAKMLSAGRGQLSYGDAIRVLIQLANPLDVSAEFFLDLAGGSKPERRSRWLLYAAARADALLEGATQARARFRPPTNLTD